MKDEDKLEINLTLDLLSKLTKFFQLGNSHPTPIYLCSKNGMLIHCNRV